MKRAILFALVIGCCGATAGCDDEAEGPGDGPGSDCESSFVLDVGGEVHDSWGEAYCAIENENDNLVIQIGGEDGDSYWSVTIANIENEDPDDEEGLPEGEYADIVNSEDDGDFWYSEFLSIEYDYQTYGSKSAGTFSGVLDDGDDTPVTGCWKNLINPEMED